MSTQDFIIELFCLVDDVRQAVPKHLQADLHPSETVAFALFFSINGLGNRAYYRWVRRDCSSLFPRLPERTRLFRLFTTYQDWAQRFLADPTVLGIVDSYGIELVHPIREGRSDNRWIVGGKLCFVLNQRGQVVAWEVATANVHDAAFHPLIERLIDESVVLTGSGNVRMVVETVLSMLTVVCHFKRVSHRGRSCLPARLTWAMVPDSV